MYLPPCQPVREASRTRSKSPVGCGVRREGLADDNLLERHTRVGVDFHDRCRRPRVSGVGDHRLRSVSLSETTSFATYLAIDVNIALIVELSKKRSVRFRRRLSIVVNHLDVIKVDSATNIRVDLDVRARGVIVRGRKPRRDRS